MPSITADRQSRAHFDFAITSIGSHTGNCVSFHDQISHFRFHQQIEAYEFLSLLNKEIEEVPLRHEAEEFTMRRQVSQIGKRNKVITDLAADLPDFLVRAFKKIIEQAEFIDHFESRRMD